MTLFKGVNNKREGQTLGVMLLENLRIPSTISVNQFVIANTSNVMDIHSSQKAKSTELK